MPPSALPPDPVFRPLGRRQQYRATAEPSVARMERVRLTPSRARAFLCLLTWSVVLARMVASIAVDRLRGRRTMADVGKRVREAFERVGGTFAKIGQQLGNRVDLLPYPICQELGRMFDRMPSFPVEQAVEAVERSCGRPLREVFSAFDPDPIGSASIACVYQAVLKSGEKVAVKVRRPGIGQRFADDLLALDWLCILGEALTLVRPGTTRMLRRDLKDMLLEELDFSMEARYAELYRRSAKKDKVKFTTAPRIHHALSSVEVIVEEFVAGVFMTELLQAVEARDQAHLARLAEQGIRPKQVARRLLMANYWGGFEGLLIHADPHPANIIIRPGGRLVFIDFGASGPPVNRIRRINWLVLSRLERNDVSGAAQASIGLLEPLPHVDADFLRKRVEHNFWRYFYSMRSKHAPWWERTTAGLWLSLMEITREMELPVTADALRGMRASLLYDTLAARLWPDLDDRVFRRYLRKYARRQARKAVKRLTAAPLRDTVASLVVSTDQFIQTGRDLLDRVRNLNENAPNRFMQAASKASFVFLTLLTAGVRLVAPVLLLVALQELLGARAGAPATLRGMAERVVLHPVYLAYFALLITVTARRLQYRISDADPEK